jgi:hypothetical protein
VKDRCHVVPNCAALVPELLLCWLVWCPPLSFVSSATQVYPDHPCYPTRAVHPCLPSAREKQLEGGDSGVLGFRVYLSAGTTRDPNAMGAGNMTSERSDAKRMDDIGTTDARHDTSRHQGTSRTNPSHTPTRTEHLWKITIPPLSINILVGVRAGLAVRYTPACVSEPTLGDIRFIFCLLIFFGRLH